MGPPREDVAKIGVSVGDQGDEKGLCCKGAVFECRLGRAGGRRGRHLRTIGIPCSREPEGLESGVADMKW